MQEGKQEQVEELERLMNKQDKSFARAINQTKEEINAKVESIEEEIERKINAKIEA
jgi:N-acetylmuramic acid 6-phosphate (MurNAc-6-P) etherase